MHIIIIHVCTSSCSPTPRNELDKLSLLFIVASTECKGGGGLENSNILFHYNSQVQLSNPSTKSLEYRILILGKNAQDFAVQAENNTITVSPY